MFLTFSHRQGYQSVFTRVLCICAGITSGCSHIHVKPPLPITVNWNQPIGHARNIYSLNLWAATDPKVGANPQFGQQLGEIRPAICRIHAAEMLQAGHAKAWIHRNGEWNRAKIDAILRNITPHCEDIMISIPSWPPTLHQGRQLPPHKYKDFAQWCAQLVRLIIQEQKHPVQYFEILNEKDSAYNGNSQAIAKLTQQAVKAIKAVTPSIKIVIGAWTHPYDKRDIQSFLDASRESNFQAFSYHHYGTHQSFSDPFKLYQAAKTIGQRPQVIRQWMDQRGLSNAELLLGETHMYSSWDKDKQKLMRSYQGAVFLALAFQQATQHNHIDGIFPWNDADNTYGLLVKKETMYALRPTGYVLKLLRQYFSRGKRFAIATPKGLDAFAVRSQTHHGLMLINSSTKPNKAPRLDMKGWQPTNSTYQIHTIDANGINMSHQTWHLRSSQTLNLPSESVTFLIFPNP